MINCESYLAHLRECGVEFFTGVPDSLLKEICACFSDKLPQKQHIIAANEGNAIGLAAGYHLATGKIGLVYMQNSGLGNAVNPLTSLSDPDVYGIPSVLMIGWRGRPGHKDEPQHVKMGKITTQMLETLGIPHIVLPTDQSEALEETRKIVEHAREHGCPVAIVVLEGSFDSFKASQNFLAKSSYSLTREEAIKTIADTIPSNTIIISTTGKSSRELFEHRANKKSGHEKDFLTIGSMGHSSQIALGVALQLQSRPIVCLDGDGAVIMQMGGLSIIGSMRPRNYLHIVLNNGSHESVGAQPTVGFNVDFGSIAKGCGYTSVHTVDDDSELKKLLQTLDYKSGPIFVEVRVAVASRKDLGRPTISPIQNKRNFMSYIGQ